MNIRRIDRTAFRMMASPDDKWLSVHAIAEYSFCPRAGLIAYENRRGEDDDETPSLFTLPKFELDAINAAISWQLKVVCLWGVGTAIASVIASQWHPLLALVVIWLGVKNVLSRLGQILELVRRRRNALKARCAEPNPSSDQLQSVNWFGLLHLGFESVRLKEPLRDTDWKFDGRPWRVLRKGSLTIPVFCTRSAVDQPHDSHRVKIAAYCRLCALAFGDASCPYGIVITGDDHSGFAVPNHPRFRARFHDCLNELRRLAAMADQRQEGAVAFDSRKCSHCPLARPRLMSRGQRIQRLGRSVEAHPVAVTHYGPQHCDCGDRFRWRPPYSPEEK